MIGIRQYALAAAAAASGIAVVLLGTLAGAEWTLPKDVAPPPGNVAGTRQCQVGKTHDRVHYSANLGCLYGNLALATLATTPLDKAWAAALAKAASDVATFASTLDGEAPESLYLKAVELELVPTQSDRTPVEVANALCGYAQSTYEDACIAYYCGSARLRGTSPELGETGQKLQHACNVVPRCLPKDLDLNREQCQKQWKDEQSRLAQLVESRQRIHEGVVGSPGAVAAVHDWAASEASFRSTLRQAVFTGDYGALAPASEAATAKAAPALLAVRKDEVQKLEEKQQALAATVRRPCEGPDADRCRLEREKAADRAERLKNAIRTEQTRIQRAAGEPDRAVQVEILKRSRAVEP